MPPPAYPRLHTPACIPPPAYPRLLQEESLLASSAPSASSAADPPYLGDPPPQPAADGALLCAVLNRPTSVQPSLFKVPP